MLKVGADPEFFLKRGDVNVSAHDIVPGSKREPFPLSVGGVQADGTAVEFTIEPAISGADFAANIRRTLEDVRKLVPADLAFDISPSIVYPEAYFKELPEFSKELGCEADYNAANGEVNPRPDNSTTLRTGAGHLHLGWTEGADPLSRSHMWDCRYIVKAIDSVASLTEKLWDKDTRRRELYGNYGAFRPKSYGVEYRVLSNAWLKYPKLWPWLFDMVKYVVDRTEEGSWEYQGSLYPWSVPEQWTTHYVNQNLNDYFGYYFPKIPNDWNT